MLQEQGDNNKDIETEQLSELGVPNSSSSKEANHFQKRETPHEENAFEPGAIASAGMVDPEVVLAPEPSIPKEVSKEPRHIHNLYATVYSFNLFTITDGAVRLIVLLHAASLGFTPIQIAFMFTFYELAGVVTNLFGGLIGVRYGLKFALFIGIGTQLVGLVLLLVTTVIFPGLNDASIDSDVRLRVTVWITFCQMLSGVAKDFVKLACKSVPKLVTKEGADDALFRLVVMVTGWKNSFKGFGTLLGAILVEFIGFEPAVGTLLGIIGIIIPVPLILMDRDIGRGSKKAGSFSWKAFQATWNVNVLSLARVFLFGSRDVWFEIAAPIFLRGILGWPEFTVGLFMGAYIMIYGQLQTATGKLYKKKKKEQTTPETFNPTLTSSDSNGPSSCCQANFQGPPSEKHVPIWAYVTTVFVVIWGVVLYPLYHKYELAGFESTRWQWAVGGTLLAGLVIFASLFAVNSAVHSYLIVLYAEGNKLTITVGTYYSANALGRLVGTILSGVIYQYTEQDYGLSVCLWVAAVFMLLAGLIATKLQPHQPLSASIA